MWAGLTPDSNEGPAAGGTVGLMRERGGEERDPERDLSGINVYNGGFWAQPRERPGAGLLSEPQRAVQLCVRVYAKRKGDGENL